MRASPPPRQAPHSLPHLGPAKEQGPPRRTPRPDGARAGTELEPGGRQPPLAEVPLAQSPGPPDSGPASISSLISQLKPEVFSSLVEIIKDVQKNAVKFYIHTQEEESPVCQEIKEYLIRLGNVECNPQAFLESKNNLDKLLIIIQNVDIAAHVHKIPALVSLKKLPSVSFAGVDSLDDVKNHTYNELFVSGGFIVSDEFVLNPDFITYERLHKFLKMLEKQSSPENLWQWKVHCKTQKKLKELGRPTYQKRHLVTAERRFEMFPHYSSNGIVITSIDDVMNSFHSLIGFHDNAEEPPAFDNHPPQTPPAVLKDECVEEEDMSLDSEDDAAVIEEPGAQGPDRGPPGSLPPPLPQAQEFRPPLPEHEHLSFLPPASGETPLDFQALKSAISLFKASAAQRPAGDYEGGAGGSSPGAFNVNPHQSFLTGPATAPGAPPRGPLLGTGGALYLAAGEAGVAPHGWAGAPGGVSSACGTPTSQDDGALGPEAARGKGPTPGSGSSASGTPNSQGGATPSGAGAARTSNPGGSSTPSSQGSLTPGPSRAVESQAAPTLTPGPARGGAHGQGLLPLPPPQGAGSVNGRGRGGGGPVPAPFDGAWGNGAGPVAVGYRGLVPGRSRPRGCREMRGGACIRGFPLGRGRGQPGGYYSDFTQDTYLSWGEEHWSPGDAYGTHRDGYNGW
ncbi:hypothetical protein COCON_G00173750 [Conger conger]|uniref:Uncharacterized protein n=1 Tax=Conger conger TaxID=82655 RepID=A0A9Q1D4D4_CONCO|nr:hypothetical protein COCON_G00173750 [Conger conger]